MKSQQKNIEQKVAESFGQLQSSAPIDLWDRIAADIGLSEEELSVKNAFEKKNSGPAPHELWTGIKKQLIIDEVWDRILLVETRRRRRAIFWWWTGSVAAVAAVLLVLITSFGVREKAVDGWSRNNPKKDQRVQRPTIKGDALTHTTANSLESKRIVQNNKIQSVIDNTGNRGANDIFLDSRNTDEENLLWKNTEIEKSTKYWESVTRNEFIPVLGQKPLRSIVSDSGSLLSTWQFNQNYSMRRRFELGLHVAFGNTWVLNNDVKNGFSTNSLIQDKISFGYSAGLDAVYRFTPTSAVYTTYDFVSVVKQNYSFYEKGSFVNRQIRLSQQKLLVGYKHNIQINEVAKRNLVLRSGGFWAHSISEEIRTGNSLSLSGFESMDFGITLSLGMEQRWKRLTAEYGIRSDIGLNNISSGNNSVPKKFDYTNTLSFEAFLSLRYQL